MVLTQMGTQHLDKDAIMVVYSVLAYNSSRLYNVSQGVRNGTEMYTPIHGVKCVSGYGITYYIVES